MPSPYAQGLDLLARVQDQVKDIKHDAIERRVTVQRWYTLGQTWNLLRMALIATGEAADDAVAASHQQRARYGTYAHRYVTALSDHARAVSQHHESELISLDNLQEHYTEALGPEAHVVHTNQTFLNTLDRNIEAIKRRQGLEMVYIRWVQLRASADLTQQAENFHSVCSRLNVRKRRADEACRRANHLQRQVFQRVKQYEHLEMEVRNVREAIQAL
ncbi:hypothetical protein HO133_005855 [Letharia lupina]|uniref:Uncharacterized protein n=1 Tax=Letharia lupina TaxID=560253 RepID=A0A8H6C890_9LECA|nr:uncharacterized protein HO133_005855 [Letharia lupina]KAF6218506.1 hypothetical protein HO133_005855 [Letharia lupina]